MMNNNERTEPNKLSKKLAQVLDQMSDASESFKKIETTIDAEYLRVEKMLNSEGNNDVSKEIKYQFSHYLKNLAQKFEK